MIADPRRSLMVNAAAYRKQMHRRSERDVTLMQSVIAGLVVAGFALAVLAIAAGVS
ncbi:hypothetical protein [Mesorhizobium sp. LSHC414A00]|uniref:hypothetical protein n=1 Tax=Mesorhizobium sp. LSHC414A00 TaxID=1287287 RepID=UPI0003CE656E|nr:hypothetical protein [Mesorhizobium sp. LSHC414A00]ESX78502.1 hypothetical protein X757_09215 [Mesorhizobium sp. LSHC414A00]